MSGRVRWVVLALVLVATFALGVAVGEALHDNPSGGGTVTFVRTLSTTP